MFGINPLVIAAAFAAGVAVTSVPAYKVGEIQGHKAGYAHAVAEAKLAGEQEVARVLEEVERARRERDAGRVPNGPDPFDRN